MHFNTGCGSIWKNYDFVDENVRGMVRERERSATLRTTTTNRRHSEVTQFACMRESAVECAGVPIAPRRI